MGRDVFHQHRNPYTDIGGNAYVDNTTLEHWKRSRTLGHDRLTGPPRVPLTVWCDPPRYPIVFVAFTLDTIADHRIDGRQSAYRVGRVA
jgi:hypothetical protein